MNSNLYSDKEYNENIKFVVEIYDTKPNCLIFKSYFYNSIVLPNIVLDYESTTSVINTFGSSISPSENKKAVKEKEREKDKENKNNFNNMKPFLIICYFDHSQHPDCLTPENTQDLSWSIRGFGSDQLSFVRDTSKEDSEKALKESWEVKEPGRAERAKRSRRKYLIQQKIENNQPLNEEDENFLKEEKEKNFKEEIPSTVVITNTNLKEENKINKNIINPSDKKSKNSTINNINTINNLNKSQTPKKALNISNPNNNNFPNINTEMTENDGNSKDINFLVEKNFNPVSLEKPLPSQDQHISSYIKNFLNYSCEKRTKILDSKFNQEQKILCDEKKIQEIKEKIEAKNEKFMKIKNIETEKMMNKLAMLNDTIKAFYDINHQHKMEQHETRTLFKLKEESKKFISKKEAEKKLMEIIQNKENDLNACIQTYKEIATSSYKSDLLEVVHDLISKKKEEFLKFELKKNEKNIKELKSIAQKYMDDCNENKWKLSNETMIKLNDLMK